MKKLISIFCVVAMIFSLAVTVNAAGTSFALTLKEQTATSVTYELSVDTDVNIQTFGICYDMKDAISKGIADGDIAVTGNSALTGLNARYVPNQDLISIKLPADANGFVLTGKATVATIVINTTNMTGAFNFTQASGSSAKNFAVVKKTDEGAVTITDSVTFPTATVNMFKPAFTAETKKGAAVDATATNIELDKDPATAYKNQYLGTAVFTATLGADVNYSETGFIFAKNGVEGKGLEKMADGNAITGKGAFEFTVAMYGIPVTDAGELAETITAIPYYITAE